MSDITQTTSVIVRVILNDQGLILASPFEFRRNHTNNSNTLPYTQITQVLGDKHVFGIITFLDSNDSDLRNIAYQFQYVLMGWNLE